VLWGCLCWSTACSSEGGQGAEPSGDAPGAAAASGGATSMAPAEAEAAPSGAADPAETAEALDPSDIQNVKPPPATVSAPVPSPGCGLGPLEAGARSIEVDGTTRTFLLDLPEGYTGGQPLPLVFAFHGATTSGEFFRNPFYGNLLSTMRDEAIVVHADALGDPTAWNTQADLPFFDAMLSELGASLCVDTARVFATGHSSGGFFTNTLGCQRGDVLRAIAPVSAGGPFGGSACSGNVAVWLAHAENDEVVAFENGVGSRDRWLSANGCSAETRAVEPEPCVEYAGCGEGQPVRWCVYQDGHDWPEFGPEGIWSFFRSL
jgi:polyhydroxybutyrate depolymerase